MTLRAPSDPKLARQMLRWWPAFNEARQLPGQADSATPERLWEIAAAKAVANSAAIARAEAKRRTAITAATKRDEAMRRLLSQDTKGRP